MELVVNAVACLLLLTVDQAAHLPCLKRLDLL